LILDVGCGCDPQGDLNIDLLKKKGYNVRTGNQRQGNYMDISKIKNYIVADFHHLPIKTKSMDLVLSSHVIEQAENPILLLREMLRVAKRKVIVRYSHRRGSGAKRPFHINYIDEDWIDRFCPDYVKAEHFTGIGDAYVTDRMKTKIPLKLIPTVERYTPFRILRKIELNLVYERKYKIPRESEAWIRTPQLSNSSRIIVIVVYNNKEILDNCFLSSHPSINLYKKVLIENVSNKGLPTLFNETIKANLPFEQDSWFVFCHQDFILNEDLSIRLRGKDVNSIYGPIGIQQLGPSKNIGQIVQTEGLLFGKKIENTYPVQTLDEQCLIIHSNLFKEGLRFDEKFRFDFYGADICMQANILGFDVHAIQLKCQHKSKPLTGIYPKSYWETRPIFAKKWNNHFPIQTTCTRFEK
jgi:hypothetical protein